MTEQRRASGDNIVRLPARLPRPAAAVRIYAHFRDFWCARRDGPIQISPMQGMPAPAKLPGRDRVYKTKFGRTPRARGRQLRKINLPARPKARRTCPGEVVRVRQRKIANLVYGSFRADDGKGDVSRATISLVPSFYFVKLRHRIVRRDAPKDFQLHVARHTVATWLENKGYSEFERALVLNHSSSRATSGYSLGHATDLKRRLLEDWAEHIEKLIQPAEGHRGTAIAKVIQR